MTLFKNIIFYLFAGLLFLTPLVLWPYTSEVFEFNKVVTTYTLTTLIMFAWVSRMIYEKKIIISRTLLDIPLLTFLATQLISTLISIDSYTSFFGYYSRFNGGFLTTLCYSLLYWAFVSNIDSKNAKNLVKVLLTSALLVSIYGVLEHFGIDKDVWVQDVKSRVFSTLGQPNWLASWLTAIIPTTIFLTIKYFKTSKAYFFLNLLLTTLFFWTLIFTKSRSGFLGLVCAIIVFVLVYLLQNGFKELKDFSKGLFASIFVFALICLISGTQWTPNISQILNQKSQEPKQVATGPALEVGGTESGVIRKIVWKGAFDIIKNYPVFGTGVETFAYSYYKFRPQEHNLVSEWDFIYNKAHNQYLNIAANSGLLGLGSYLTLILFSLYMVFKNRDYSAPIISGFVSLLATNFFGFSVMPTDLLFFIMPAFSFVLVKKDQEKQKDILPRLDSGQILLLIIATFSSLYILNSIIGYWKADVSYAKAKDLNARKRPDLAQSYIVKAINLAPQQALYHNELASIYTSLALSEYNSKNASKAAELADYATNESQKASELAPANINIKRNKFGMYVMLSQINKNYIVQAGQTLIEATKQAPTDAKLLYNLALFYIQVGQPTQAQETFEKTIQMKSNYKEARLAYAVFLIDKKDMAKARQQLEYILKYIDPQDALTKQTLDSIK